jgi:uncharacterized repeat protein (TIGR01451 family)
MAVSQKVWRSLAFGCLTVMLGFVAACGDDDGAVPSPGPSPEAGAISGRVTDQSTGNGIVGATVGTTPATTIALTDAQGNFTIANVEAGSYAVTASKDGFNSASTTVVVTDGATATANLALTPSAGPVDTLGTVTGLVTRRSGDPVPAGTSVRILSNTSSCADTTAANLVTTATTDAGGRYLVEDLAAGSYIACVDVTIGGQAFSGRTGFVINGGEITSADITVGRDLDQTTDPNVGGTPITLDANGNFNGIIRFVDWDADGTAAQDCNVIFTQHLWVAEVFQDLDNDGVVDTGEPRVSGVRVEWSLNQAGGGVIVNDPVTGAPIFVRGTTGVIVDTDDPFLDPVQAESAKAAASGISPQFKVDDTHAVTYTNDIAQSVDFNGQLVSLVAGQTWIIVSSPVEGFTDVIAFSPDLSRATRANGDKAFAIKRWVNWRTQVAELEPFGGTARTDSLRATPVADGGTITNRLDRTPQIGALPCNPTNGATGTVCDLSNRAFIGIVISRLRLDSPFTFRNGSVQFVVLDDSPDTDIDDIDSDGTPGGLIFTGGGPISVDENTASDSFSMNTAVTFNCEIDANNPTECIDVDVAATATNTAGQTLQNMGFTITSGVTTEEAAVAVTVSLDSTIFFATVDPTSPVGFTFPDILNRMIAGQADIQSQFRIRIFDEFGEVCDEIIVNKRWVSSVLRLFKQGPTTVALNQDFSYTVTVINDGEDASSAVIIADTLPILNAFPDPGGPFAADTARDGNQAFRYLTDAPTFDPTAIRYYIDLDDDEPGTTVDVCFQAPTSNTTSTSINPGGGFPAAFTPPRADGQCLAVVNFATVAAARAAATAASTSTAGGNTILDQVVIVEYFDTSVLSRTQPGGAIEAEDSFAITLRAIQSVNNFRLPTGAIPTRFQRNGQWCNIATVTSAENDFAADTVCTRVVEALLEVRKTANDALVPAGDQTTFDIHIGNNGSDPLLNVTVNDTLDASWLVPVTSDPGLVMIDSLCTGCTATFNADSTIITITVPSVPSTDTNNNGVFDDTEGFFVGRLVVRTPLASGVFCNRVTVTSVLPFGGVTLRDSDLACVVTQVQIEFDIRNDDGLRTSAGDFTDVETFQVGDSIVYRTSITNRSNVAATNVSVLWEIAPRTRIIQFIRTLGPPSFTAPTPSTITCSTATDTCSVTVASLASGASIILDYLTFAQFQGDDVNRLTLSASELSTPVVNEEPTTVNP